MASRSSVLRCLRTRRPALVGLMEKSGKLRISPVLRLSRQLATEAVSPASSLIRIIPLPPQPPVTKFLEKPSSAITTVYKFPSLEPLGFEAYPSAFLQSQLRRDILHRAIVFEGDNERLGRARTKTRSEIHGSGRKLRPQKGTGRARLGSKSSPMLRGGAKAHGPRPERSFATKLQRKVYDLAYRIALSYRYKRGDLVVVDDISHHEFPDAHYVKEMLDRNQWGRDNRNTLFVSMKPNAGLKDAMMRLEKEGRTLSVDEVDCKNLLEMGRIVIEKDALNHFLEKRCPPEVRN